MYFPRNWEFGSALSKHRNFGGGGRGWNAQTTPSVRYWSSHNAHTGGFFLTPQKISERDEALVQSALTPTSGVYRTWEFHKLVSQPVDCPSDAITQFTHFLCEWSLLNTQPNNKIIHAKCCQASRHICMYIRTTTLQLDTLDHCI
jgi:hypothetical protein